MGLPGAAKLDAANTAFYTGINAALSSKVPGLYSQFTHTMPATGTSVDVIFVDGEPVPREWLGAKQAKQLQAFSRNYPLKQYEKTLEIPMVQIRGDVQGVINTRINDFTSSAPQFWDSLITAQLLANTHVGYDGVTLLNNTHPNAGGGSSDNLHTASLSHSVMNTMNDYFQQLRSIDGEFMQGRLTHVMVGPALERIGKEVTGSDRPVVFDGVGAQDGNTSVAAAVLLQNYIGGPVGLIVNPRLTGNENFGFDLSRGTRKPMVLAEFRAIEATTLSDPTDPNVFNYDDWLASLTADAALIPGDWRTVYGSVS